MELFLDSANLEEIRFWSERLSIDAMGGADVFLYLIILATPGFGGRP